jgi:Glycosyl transferase family 2
MAQSSEGFEAAAINRGRRLLGTDLVNVRRLSHPRFGQLATQLYGVKSEAIERGLERQRAEGGRLGEILRKQGLLDREQLKGILRTQATWVAREINKGAPPILPFKESFSLCLPAYNEQDNIEDTLDAACAILPEFVERFELVVVDDGSKDETGLVLARFAEKEPRLCIVTHAENRGYGAAITSALRSSQGDLVCILDSDGQFSLLNLPELLLRMGTADVVIGYRKKRADSPIRLLNAWAWNRLMRVLLGIAVRDLDCAFKVFRQDTVQNLSLTSRGACISAEILVQCVRRGLKIAEVPVDHYSRSHGAPSGAALRVIAKAFRELPHLMKYRWAPVPHASPSRAIDCEAEHTAEGRSETGSI